MLAFTTALLAFNGAPVARPAVSRASSATMQLTKKVSYKIPSRSALWPTAAAMCGQALGRALRYGGELLSSLSVRMPECCIAPGSALAQVVSFDQDGVFEGREISVAKAPVRLLERVEELRLLSSIADAGLLSSAEEAGVFSKLEAAGAFSTAESLLPLGARSTDHARHCTGASLAHAHTRASLAERLPPRLPPCSR